MSVMSRTRQHSIKSSWFSDIARIELEWFDSRSLAEQAEWKAIKEENPSYNQAFSFRPPAPDDPIVVLGVGGVILSSEGSSRRVLKRMTKEEYACERARRVAERSKSA